MCGLAYAHDFTGQPVNNEILNRFDAQRARGTQGFGLFDGVNKNIVRATKENKILKWLVKYDSNLILFHHRWPSPGAVKNIKPGAHPYTTGRHYGDNEYILIHNGSVWNNHQLLDDHEALGIKYRSLQRDFTFSDSESLLWDFASAIERNQKTITAYGDIAFICIKLHKGELDKLYFARNMDRPLVMQKDRTSLVLSSEGEGEEVKPNILHTWNYKTKRLSKKDFYVPIYATDEPYDFHKYDHTYKTSAPAVGDILTSDDMTWFNRQKVKLLGADNQIITKPVKIHKFQTDEEIFEDMESFLPDKNEIQALAMDYLNMMNGHFDTAIYAMEADYIDKESTAQWLDDYKQLRVLELAMQLVTYDKEYLNGDSISSYWIKGGGNLEPTRLPV